MQIRDSLGPTKMTLVLELILMRCHELVMTWEPSLEGWGTSLLIMSIPDVRSRIARLGSIIEARSLKVNEFDL